MSLVAVLCIVVASAGIAVHSSSLHPGELDPSFGHSGTVRIDFNADHAVAGGIGIGPGDRIIVSGGAWPTFGDGDFAVARLSPDGSLDPTFGTGGTVAHDFSGHGSPDVASGGAVQLDGKVIVVGTTLSFGSLDFALLRVSNDGTLDSTFGTGGAVVTDILGFDDGAAAVAIQADGKIVAVGFTNRGFSLTQHSDFAIVRYNTDGTLDSSFGSGGKVTTDFNNLGDIAYAVAIQHDGKIVVAGSCEVTPITTFIRFFALARYNPDGSLDSSFGNGGKITTRFFGQFDEAYSVAIQSDGKIVAAGMATNPDGSDFGLARYNGDGSLDTSFGDAGKVHTDFFKGDDEASAVVIQQNGKLVAAGTAASAPEGQPDFALARYSQDGSLDTGFGQGGKVTTDFFNADDGITAAALQRDGAIVVCGRANVGVSPRFVVARYEGDVVVLAIISASISGKNLVVAGSNFDRGAVILLDGVEQRTLHDEQDPNTLVGKKSAKRIASGQQVSLQVRDSDGTLSPVFPFTRP